MISSASAVRNYLHAHKRATILVITIAAVVLATSLCYSSTPDIAAATTTHAHTSSPTETRFTAYLTAYTYWDNTPPGSAVVSNPILHQQAGGTGTYDDPITLAVGHSIMSGIDVLDYPAGTRFYIPNLRKYFIAEDTCGDGPMPQNGPCHIGYHGHPWFDLWIDGASGIKDQANECAEAITDLHLVIEHPAKKYAAVAGPIFTTSCAEQFGDAIVIQK